jgi:hypothetical protein
VGHHGDTDLGAETGGAVQEQAQMTEDIRQWIV